MLLQTHRRVRLLKQRRVSNIAVLTQTMELVYIGAGSNLGNREEHILKAEKKVSKFIADVNRSRLYETAPRYRENQPVYLNAVFRGKTGLAPPELLLRLNEIENEAGRDRRASGWMGPRPIDLDILLYGRRIVQSEKLTIPHLRISERGFVLYPLLELDPLLKDPVTGVRYAEWAAALPPQGIYYHTVMPL